MGKICVVYHDHHDSRIGGKAYYRHREVSDKKGFAHHYIYHNNDSGDRVHNPTSASWTEMKGIPKLFTVDQAQFVNNRIVPLTQPHSRHGQSQVSSTLAPPTSQVGLSGYGMNVQDMSMTGLTVGNPTNTAGVQFGLPHATAAPLLPPMPSGFYDMPGSYAAVTTFPASPYSMGSNEQNRGLHHGLPSTSAFHGRGDEMDMDAPKGHRVSELESRSSGPGNGPPENYFTATNKRLPASSLFEHKAQYYLKWTGCVAALAKVSDVDPRKNASNNNYELFTGSLTNAILVYCLHPADGWMITPQAWYDRQGIPDFWWIWTGKNKQDEDVQVAGLVVEDKRAGEPISAAVKDLILYNEIVKNAGAKHGIRLLEKRFYIARAGRKIAFFYSHKGSSTRYYYPKDQQKIYDVGNDEAQVYHILKKLEVEIVDMANKLDN